MKMTASRRLFVQTGLALVLAFAAVATWAGQFSVTASNNTFTITRSAATETEYVTYRTVSLSALEGAHFEAVSNDLTFGVGETTKTVAVTEKPISDASLVHRYQSGTFRTYGFEVLDGKDGALLAETTRQLDYGNTYKFVNAYVSGSGNNLVYFNIGSSYNGQATTFSTDMDIGKYYDEKHAGSKNKWIKVTDAGFKQAVHTVSSTQFFNRVGATREYLQGLGYRFYATICFEARDVDDGYHHVQVLTDNESTYDGDDSAGDVGTPDKSFYKETHELAQRGRIEDPNSALYFVPHRFSYKDRATERSNAGQLPFNGFSEFSRTDNIMYGQKVKSTDLLANGVGAFSFSPSSVTNLNIRFDGAGEDDDDWQFRDLFVRMALVDARRPAVTSVLVSQGLNVQYNKVTITFVFDEIVKAPNVLLNTSWGDFAVQENENSRANVVAFSGHITADPDTPLAIRGFSGAITDLVGNPMSGISDGIQAQLAENKVGAFPPPAISNDVVQIATVSDLYNYSKMVEENPRLSGVLTGDIDMSHLTPFLAFPAIGGVFGFAGTFDGRGHTISGIKAISVASGSKGKGLFSSITPSGVVKNLAVVDLEVEGSGSLAFGGICGKNSGTVEGCWFSGEYYPDGSMDGDYGGIVGVNESRGTVRNCVSVEKLMTPSCDVVGKNEGTLDNAWFLNERYLSSGRTCYVLNGGVTDGTQVWYQTIGTDAVPRRFGGTVYKHGDTYVNAITHSWGSQTYVWSEDFSNVTATAVCSVGGEEHAETYAATSWVSKQPTCTAPGTTTWTAYVPSNAYGFTRQTKDQEGVPAPVGYPAYLSDAGEAILANYADWGRRYGYDLDSAHETAFLLDISPNQSIPDNAALLKVVDFSRSETNLHFELASDVAKLKQNGLELGTYALCNGYLTLNVSPVPFTSGGPVFAAGFPVSTDSQGHARVNVDLTNLSPVILETLFPSSAFIRPAITIKQPRPAQ